jgi:hypothetical protein
MPSPRQPIHILDQTTNSRFLPAKSVLSALLHTWPTPLEELQFVWWHMSQQHFWVQAYSSNDVAVLETA